MFIYSPNQILEEGCGDECITTGMGAAFFLHHYAVNLGVGQFKCIDAYAVLGASK